MAEKQGVRINKFLSEIGFCSRREADQLLRDQRVTINEKVAQLGATVSYNDVVKVDGDILSASKKDKPIYIALNKPIGVVCTTDGKRERDNVVDFIGHDKRIFPIGRLDKDSDGLLLLTNDGDIVNKILRAGNQHDKEYLVTVNKTVNSNFIKGMAGGVPILGTTTKKCEVEYVSRNQFRIVLKQGLNRQIRRMCQHFGYEVKALTRIRIMNIKLDMPAGKWRNLKDHEIDELNEMLAASSSLGAAVQTKKKKSKPDTFKPRPEGSAKPERKGKRPAGKGKGDSKDAAFNPKSRNLRKLGGRGKRR
ncbi:23S rRNA pseudouridine(2604) synthase RluF [Prolixibacteraceae bacterium JC049]|nr:23S rRNA pseudouridine(2604) synthase RluF [Prolixibacteraceae bacterium JC049]